MPDSLLPEPARDPGLSLSSPEAVPALPRGPETASLPTAARGRMGVRSVFGLHAKPRTVWAPISFGVTRLGCGGEAPGAVRPGGQSAALEDFYLARSVTVLWTGKVLQDNHLRVVACRRNLVFQPFEGLPTGHNARAIGG